MKTLRALDIMPKDTKDIKKYIRDVVNIKFENIF